jgi:hypothetical protein
LRTSPSLVSCGQVSHFLTQASRSKGLRLAARKARAVATDRCGRPCNVGAEHARVNEQLDAGFLRRSDHCSMLLDALTQIGRRYEQQSFNSGERRDERLRRCIVAASHLDTSRLAVRGSCLPVEVSACHGENLAQSLIRNAGCCSAPAGDWSGLRREFYLVSTLPGRTLRASVRQTNGTSLRRPGI